MSSQSRHLGLPDTLDFRPEDLLNQVLIQLLHQLTSFLFETRLRLYVSQGIEL
jgi:hypothetical protein